jgi:hypothetical protein
MQGLRCLAGFEIHHAGERWQSVLEPFTIDVGMPIDETRDHEATACIDALCCGSTNRFYIGAGTRREDRSVRDRDRFDDVIVRIKGGKLAARNSEIGKATRRRRINRSRPLPCRVWALTVHAHTTSPDSR